MPVNDGEFKIVGFPLSVESLAKLDRLAVKGGLTRAKLIQNMVEAGIDFLEGCEGWGVFAIRKIFDDMKEVLHKRLKYKVA
jgi:hypothetical protein